MSLRNVEIIIMASKVRRSQNLSINQYDGSPVQVLIISTGETEEARLERKETQNDVEVGNKF
jgi:hypothetical protein